MAALLALPFVVWTASGSRWLTFGSFLGVSALGICVEKFATTRPAPHAATEVDKRARRRGLVLDLALLVVAASVWLSGAPLVVCWITFGVVVAVSFVSGRRSATPDVSAAASAG